MLPGPGVMCAHLSALNPDEGASGGRVDHPERHLLLAHERVLRRCLPTVKNDFKTRSGQNLEYPRGAGTDFRVLKLSQNSERD